MGHGIQGAWGEIKMMGRDCFEAVIQVYKTMEFRSPHYYGYHQGKNQHGGFDKGRVDPDITVIGYKEQSKGSRQG